MKNLTNDGQILATVHPHEKPPEKPTRPSHCVAGYDDGTVRLFDLGRVEMIMKIHPHGTPVTAVTFSADGKWLKSHCVAGYDGTVSLFDLGMVVIMEIPSYGTTVTFSADGKWLKSHCVAGCDGTVSLFDLGTVEMIIKIHLRGA